MIFIYPEIEEKNLSAVYSMKFDTGDKYIGSSTNIYKRFKMWERQIRTKSITLPSKIISALKDASVVTFEILDLEKDKKILRGKETLHYFMAWDEQLLIGKDLLNRHIPSLIVLQKEYLDYEIQKAKNFPHIWGNRAY
jgi:hypothetical protein